MFTIAFWRSAAEHAIVAGLTAFTGSLVLTTTPTVKGLVAAGVAAGSAALYALVKQLGAAQSAAGKLEVPAPKSKA
jgi:anti-sigma-K factor RskA